MEVADKILEKDECPFLASCSKMKNEDYDEQIRVCIKNYESCARYQSVSEHETHYRVAA